MHARKDGWNRAFYIKHGVPGIANLPMTAKVVQEPWMKIKHLNSPTIFDGQIGVYDYRWGPTAGYRVVDDQREDVRQVVIRKNVVVSSKPTLRTARRSAASCSSAAARAPRTSAR